MLDDRALTCSHRCARRRARLCRVGAEVYIDAVLASAPAPVQQGALDAIDALAPNAGGGEEAWRRWRPRLSSR